jgi:hypothetical protein
VSIQKLSNLGVHPLLSEHLMAIESLREKRLRMIEVYREKYSESIQKEFEYMVQEIENEMSIAKKDLKLDMFKCVHKKKQRIAEEYRKSHKRKKTNMV